MPRSRSSGPTPSGWESKTELLTKFDFHIHVPAGAVPKDGPSAGVAMFTSLVSLLLQRPARPDVAMTGEITLRGLVLPIGGLKEKVIAAKHAGIKTVIVPERNRKDIAELGKEVTKDLQFAYVSNTAEVLQIALGADDKRPDGEARSRRSVKEVRQEQAQPRERDQKDRRNDHGQQERHGPPENRL